EAAVAELVERRRLLGDQGGLALGQDQDAGDEAHLPGDAGQVGEQHEGIVVGRDRGADALAAGVLGGIGADHVVGGDEIVVAQALGGLGIVADNGGSGADVTDGKGTAELHCLSPHCWERATPVAPLLHVSTSYERHWSGALPAKTTPRRLPSA